jgi:hypothetical protein
VACWSGRGLESMADRLRADAMRLHLLLGLGILQAVAASHFR